jgi:hypothetical protein
MLMLDRFHPTAEERERMDRLPDRTLFQTAAWGSVLAATESLERVDAVVRDGASTVGYFTGYIARKFGLRILGSPLRGWSTWYMGFNLEHGVPRSEALRALARFAFRELGCAHLEARDRRLDPDEARASGFEWQRSTTWEVDLTRSEDELWAAFSSACRRCIRKAEKCGVTIEEVPSDDADFPGEYYSQLEDVYAKQSLVPSYGLARVRALVEALPPAQNLLLRARDPDGRCIATGIFPAMNGVAYFWGGASWRQHQILRPNEAIMWHAFRYWKRRGVAALDLGGGYEQYKTKYAPRQVEVPFVRQSKYPGLLRLRTAAWHAYHAQRRVRAIVRASPVGSRTG